MGKSRVMGKEETDWGGRVELAAAGGWYVKAFLRRREMKRKYGLVEQMIAAEPPNRKKPVLKSGFGIPGKHYDQKEI